MAHKRALETLNQTLKGLHNDSKIFGGAISLLSGDFRQTLPVIPRSTAADEINPCLKPSNMWGYVKKLQLPANMRDQLVGTLHSFKSIDCVTNEDTNYPTEFLIFLDVPDIPPHNLQLKTGSIVIMLRHLNQPILCNGTRLLIRKLMSNVFHATIPMIPTDMPFEFKRTQFSTRLAFAMTINKANPRLFVVST
ncbi:uncharacterized protein LOC143196315 [Rhynchophorus ferrugineus]|uniref:uncharacterized protein LOC143196315 n=1 Tax=Rhynchophorus ferrugineus TaxID=354439 RepID=UPI003FCCEA07